MAGKTYDMRFNLSATQDSGYKSTFTSAQRQLAEMQKEINALSKIQSDVSSYQKQQNAINATKNKLSVLQQQYDNIQKEIQETEGYSSSLENKLLSKQQQIDRTNQSLAKEQERLAALDKALTDAGVSTDNLEQETKELAQEINDLKEAQEDVADSAQDMGDESSVAINDLESALAAAGLAKLFKEIGEEIVACNKASIEFESAITGVYKTVDGTDAQLTAISDEIKDMTSNMPATTTEISAVAEAAGQLGIATDDVMTFTQVMIDMGESTNLTADEAATSLAKFSNITGTVASDYSRLGSVIVDLGNNYATTEADIVAMSTRLASAGTLAGFTEPEIMALSAAMSSVGIEAEAGGTAMTQTLNEIETAVATGGDSLIEFARISGMTASEFSQTWEDNAIYALQSFIGGLGELDKQGENAVLVLDELGLTGVRQSNMLKSLGLAADTLGDSIITANEAWEDNTALSEEAGKRYATTESKLAMLQNSYNNLQVAVGDAYTPALQKAADVGIDILEGVTEFTENNPNLVRALGAATVGFLAMSAGVTACVVATKAMDAVVKTNPYLMLGAAIAGTVVALGTFIATTVAATEEQEELSYASQEQHDRLQELNKEYEEVCSTYGETSYEAQSLQWQISDLSAEFEDSKQTLEEFYAEAAESAKEAQEALENYRDATESIDNQYESTVSLVNKLEDLADQSIITASAESQMKVIVDQLNESVEGLNLTYDDVISKGDNVTDYIKAIAEAQRNQEMLSTAMTEWANADAEQDSLNKQLEEATANLAAKQEAYDLYVAQRNSELDRRHGGAYWIHFFTTLPEYNKYKKELDDAQGAFDNFTLSVSKNATELDEASSDISRLSGELQIVEGVTYSAADAVEMSMQNIQMEINNLCSAYDEAYATAYESINNQIGLFDTMTTSVGEATLSVEQMQTAWESQVEYLELYSENIEKAMDFGLDQSLISQLSDGTEESAGYLNSIIATLEELGSGTDEAAEFIESFNEQFKEVEEAKETFSGSVAEMETDFQNKLNDILDDATGFINDLEMEDDAAQAAKDTMTAYINEIINGGNNAAQAAATARNNIISALESGEYTPQATINATSELDFVGGSGGHYSYYASGTNYAASGLAVVGENGPELVNFNGGEQVYTAHETERILRGMVAAPSREPELLSLDLGYGGYTQPIQVVIQVNGDVSPETVDSLHKFGDDFAEKVRAVINEDRVNSARRAYA